MSVIRVIRCSAGRWAEFESLAPRARAAAGEWESDWPVALRLLPKSRSHDPMVFMIMHLRLVP